MGASICYTDGPQEIRCRVCLLLSRIFVPSSESARHRYLHTRSRSLADYVFLTALKTQRACCSPGARQADAEVRGRDPAGDTRGGRGGQTRERCASAGPSLRPEAACGRTRQQTPRIASRIQLGHCSKRDTHVTSHGASTCGNSGVHPKSRQSPHLHRARRAPARRRCAGSSAFGLRLCLRHSIKGKEGK